MSVPLLQIDAFAERAFVGNPAAVCLLDGDGRYDAEWMQSVAEEMNLSETAFVAPRDGGDGCFSIRWFTPAVEVKLCGHATLAAAHALWTAGAVDAGTDLRFESLSGELVATQREGLIELDFPARSQHRVEPAAGLIEALGAMPAYVGESEEGDLLVELHSADDVRGLQPDIAALGAMAARGIMVTAAGDRGYDFVSRFFAPAVGVDEDPVTGSAHCCLGPFWGARLRRSELRAYQASARGGEVSVRLAGARVFLGGRAVTVSTGTLDC